MSCFPFMFVIILILFHRFLLLLCEKKPVWKVLLGKFKDIENKAENNIFRFPIIDLNLTFILIIHTKINSHVFTTMSHGHSSKADRLMVWLILDWIRYLICIRISCHFHLFQLFIYQLLFNRGAEKFKGFK